jgi:hypothetical protein
MAEEATTQRDEVTVLIDRLADSWNESDKAAVLVMALKSASLIVADVDYPIYS